MSELELETRAKQGVVIESGVRIPLGKLADKIGVSPELGFWWRHFIEENEMLDWGFSGYIYSNARAFDYRDTGASNKAKPIGMGGMTAFRLTKIYNLGRGKYKTDLEWVSTFGYSFFMYEDEYRPFNEVRPEDEDSRVRGLSAPVVGQGVRFTIENLGLYVNYNYSPYGKFSSHVEDDFGSHSLNLGIIYKP
ncbi:MAG: hypothetical protein BM557_03455 [Flavobacterium sp. MedPE-SWcel]|nr:MAG: hypothetical protein BM557_03455 [Flavobacterium sp. MedPE-SWcel]